MKKVIRATVNTIIFLLGGKGEYRKEAEADGICYYNGQK